MVTRRAMLLGTAGVAVAGCAPRRLPPAPVPDGPATVGWRWVPGQVLTYRTVTQRIAGRVTLSRAEEWTYLVQELDAQNIALLEGRLSAFGAGAYVDDEPVPDRVVAGPRTAEQATASQPVTLKLGMDGRLVSCSASGFAARLPHALLALRLPRTPITIHDEWSDPGIAGPFAELLPLAMDRSAWGATRLQEWFHHDDSATAIFAVLGAVETASNGPTLRIEGSAWWDAERGRLSRRTQRVEVDPPSTDPDAGPGRLTLTTEIV